MSKINGHEFFKNKQVVLTSGMPSSVVNASSTTKITSVYVPANTFGAGDVLHIEWVVKLTGLTEGNFSSNLYWNETDDLTTPTQLTTRSVANSNLGYKQNRRLSIAVTNGTGNGSIMYGVGGALDSDFALAGFAISSGLALNWTIDSYLILAGFCGTGTGVRTEFFKVSN